MSAITEPREQVRVVRRPALDHRDTPDELGTDVTDNLSAFLLIYAPHNGTHSAGVGHRRPDSSHRVGCARAARGYK
jgi:hypothetical protein